MCDHNKRRGLSLNDCLLLSTIVQFDVRIVNLVLLCLHEVQVQRGHILLHFLLERLDNRSAFIDFLTCTCVSVTYVLSRLPHYGDGVLSVPIQAVLQVVRLLAGNLLGHLGERGSKRLRV